MSVEYNLYGEDGRKPVPVEGIDYNVNGYNGPTVKKIISVLLKKRLRKCVRKHLKLLQKMGFKKIVVSKNSVKNILYNHHS